MEIPFDRFPGLTDLLERMARFSIDSPGREYLEICSDIDTVWSAIDEVMEPFDDDGDAAPSRAVIHRIYATPAYLSYRAAAKQLFGAPFHDGVEELEWLQKLKQEREIRDKNGGYTPDEYQALRKLVRLGAAALRREMPNGES